MNLQAASSLDFDLYPSNRIEVLAGKWRGYGREGYASEMHVRVIQDTIEGTGVIYSDADPRLQIPVILEGGFLNQELLIVDYRSSDRARRHHGVMMLRLSDCGTELTGSYNGNSPVRGSIVNGVITFKKPALL
jgi:hypothetical protein